MVTYHTRIKQKIRCVCVYVYEFRQNVNMLSIILSFKTRLCGQTNYSNFIQKVNVLQRQYLEDIELVHN